MVDFDGTACLHDVAEHLLMEFGEGDWATLDNAWERRELDGRETLARQDAMLRADRDTMIRFVLEHCPMDPTFGPFCRWLAPHKVPVTIVSDGFGFYIEPLLAYHGLPYVSVVTNQQEWDTAGLPGSLRFVNRNVECRGCGTCKMQAVLRARRERGPVIFIGEGASDRYAALYADLVFAKDALPAYCRADGVPFTAWTTFDDVRDHLEIASEVPGPISPERCPGWTPERG